MRVLLGVAMLCGVGLFGADKKGYLLTITDGKQINFDMPVSARGGWTRSEVTQAKGPTQWIVIETRPRETPGVVAGTVSLSPSREDPRKTPVADFTVALGERVTIRGNAEYGLGPLTLTLTEEARDCGYARGDVRTFAPSLIIESAYLSHGVCYVDLQNASAKGITAVSLGYAERPGAGPMSHSFSRKLGPCGPSSSLAQPSKCSRGAKFRW